MKIGEFFDLRDIPKHVGVIEKIDQRLKRFGKTHQDIFKNWNFSTPQQSEWMGIEIEVENASEFTGNFSCSDNLIMLKADGSLRNDGCEIISRAVDAKDLLATVGYTYTMLKACKKIMPNFSWRTSIHIHINVRELTQEEFLKFILIYLLFERGLFRYCDVKRRDGNFCVPLLECDGFVTDFFIELKRLLKSSSRKLDFKTLLKQWDKYAALGAFRIRDLGTLEFRHMPGTDDPVKIYGWVCLIHALCNAAKTMDTKKLLASIVELNTLSNYGELQEQVFREYSPLMPSTFREDIMESVIKIKENLYYTPINKIIAKHNRNGLSGYVAKLNQRKKNKDECNKEERLRQYIDNNTNYYQDDPVLNHYTTEIPAPQFITTSQILNNMGIAPGIAPAPSQTWMEFLQTITPGPSIISPLGSFAADDLPQTHQQNDDGEESDSFDDGTEQSV